MESATQNASLALYRHLCKNIVGTEKDVKTIRLMNTVRDHLHSNKRSTYITSGSVGEGLLMRGSDFDIMAVLKEIEVCEDTNIHFKANKIYFTIEQEDTQPGFTKLCLVYRDDQCCFELCNKIGSDFYFSNRLFKQRCANEIFSTVHGPCLTDENGIFDCVNCLHSKIWITPAKPWVTRSNNYWPRNDVKQAIVKHGVLFVPVGVKGSTQEELEWRMSFSVGEKLLIYAFTHTQLLCYSLMKILLKDVIYLNVDCKELLCSYFMKTILFWICEELPLSEWKPENLISCFMRCFRRLIYCVEYSLCPHYFLPDNNLFENKIQGHAQKTLLDKLYILYNHGWQCILLSDQISNMNANLSDIIKEKSNSYAKSVERLLTSHMFLIDLLHTTINCLLEKVIYKVLSINSSEIKYVYIHYLSKFCCKNKRILPLNDLSYNKSAYKKYNICISTLLLNTHHDAVSGWLRVALFFYTRNQYNTALHILQYSLLKCTPEKLHQLRQFSDIHYKLLDIQLFRNMSIFQLWKFMLLDLVRVENFTPNELKYDFRLIKNCFVPPIVYAQFQCFLCHYHLKNTRQCWECLRDLQLTIEKQYLIATRNLKGVSYCILNICFKLLGDIKSATQALKQFLEILEHQEKNKAVQQFLLM